MGITPLMYGETDIIKLIFPGICINGLGFIFGLLVMMWHLSRDFYFKHLKKYKKYLFLLMPIESQFISDTCICQIFHP